MREGGFSATTPAEPTGHPPEGSARQPSKIDYAGGAITIAQHGVLQGERAIVVFDHEPVVAVSALASPALRFCRKPLNRCLGGHNGKWLVDVESLQLSANHVADEL